MTTTTTTTTTMTTMTTTTMMMMMMMIVVVRLVEILKKILTGSLLCFFFFFFLQGLYNPLSKFELCLSSIWAIKQDWEQKLLFLTVQEGAESADTKLLIKKA